MGKEGYEDEIPPEVVLGALDSHVNRVEQVERVQKPTRARGGPTSCCPPCRGSEAKEGGRKAYDVEKPIEPY